MELFKKRKMSGREDKTPDVDSTFKLSKQIAIQDIQETAEKEEIDDHCCHGDSQERLLDSLDRKEESDEGNKSLRQFEASSSYICNDLDAPAVPKAKDNLQGIKIRRKT